MDNPPPIPPRPPGYEINVEARPPLPPRREPRPYSYTSQRSQQQQTPPRPAPQQSQAPPPQQQRQQQKLYWSPLFYPDGSPQPIFEAFMDAFFTAMDKRNTGTITPEQYSEFMDVQKFLTEHNIWKAWLKPLVGHTPEDHADYEMKLTLEIWYFDHEVVRRYPNKEPIAQGGMPLLTRTGFKEVMAVETADEPERAFRGLNLAMKHYGVWLQMGPLPRDMLPQTAPPQVVARIEAATARRQMESKRRIDAVRMQCEIEARGRQAALDLISDNRYVHHYYHY